MVLPSRGSLFSMISTLGGPLNVLLFPSQIINARNKRLFGTNVGMRILRPKF